MPTQQQIHSFTQVFHVEAIARLAAEPLLVNQALKTLDRWQAQRGASPADPYLEEWKTLLRGDLVQLKNRVCAEDDHAATLRNTSHLGFMLTPAERQALRTQSMV